MQKFDVFEISGGMYLVVQADHLLSLNTIIVVPVLPQSAFPELSKLTLDLEIGGRRYRVRTHMPLTIEATRLMGKGPIHHLTPDEGQKVMEGLNTILWGF